MKTFDPNKTYSLDNAKVILKDKICEAIETLVESKNRIIRLEIKIDPIDLLSWISAQETKTKIYWSNRDNTFEVAGVGLAYGLQGTNVIDYDAIFTELRKYLSAENKNIKFFGGIAFNEKSIDKYWESFGSYRFILPMFEVLRKGDETFFACHLSSDAAKRDQLAATLKALDELKAHNASSHGFDELPIPLTRRDEPAREDWLKGLKNVLAALSTKALEKVVLARRSSFKFESALNPVAFLARLKEISSDCYHFCFQMDEGYAFIGASPERLYKREKNIISSEALAGTRPRGESVEEDEKLKNELLTSNKDRQEHLYVIDFIKKSFESLCSTISVDPNVGILPLQSGHHLLTTIEGSLKKDTDNATILETLHPTPAVAGIPSERALKVIANFEPFKRGWYAGPIGYVGYDVTEFAVAIRSGLLSKNDFLLYAGAGIVEGSIPQEEWNEIETKLSTFTKIFENANTKSAQYK